MIYCIVGASASGKSTLVRELVDKGYNRIKSYTSRPIREEEKGLDEKHLDYHFDPYAMVELIKTDELKCIRFYAGWMYGYEYDTLLDNINNDLTEIAIVDPQGVRDLRMLLGSENVKTIYLKIKEGTRRRRLEARGDNRDEVVRRILADRVDFRNYEADYVIETEDFDDSLHEVINILERR